MTPWMILLAVSIGPLFAVLDSFGDEENDAEPEGSEGGEGSEQIGSDTADDLLTGAGGNDQISGLGGNDTLDGQGGEDLIEGGAGDDSIEGGDGNDTAIGGAGTDSVSGGPGNDTLYHGTEENPLDDAEDRIAGDEGDDTIIMGGANLATAGGQGLDTFRLANGVEAAGRIVDFDASEDRIEVETAPGATVTLDAQGAVDEGWQLSFSNGASVVLENITSDLPDSVISFVPAVPQEVGDNPIIPRLPGIGEDARGSMPAGVPFSSERGTDGDEEYLGVDTIAGFADYSGGMDSMTGGALNDTLIGGADSDLVQGGAGDDVLFGAFRPVDRADDASADTVVGGAGDDILILGGGDQATGGLGSDAFVAVQDTTGNVTVTDFDVTEDGLVIETPTGVALSVSGQTVTDAGVVINLSSGATMTLSGLTAAIPENLIAVVEVAPVVPR